MAAMMVVGFVNFDNLLLKKHKINRKPDNTKIKHREV